MLQWVDGVKVQAEGVIFIRLALAPHSTNNMDYSLYVLGGLSYLCYECLNNVYVDVHVCH